MSCYDRAKYPSRVDAISIAEQHAMIVNETTCAKCGCWHMREPLNEEEADRAAASYRTELAFLYPALAAQRGWL